MENNYLAEIRKFEKKEVTVRYYIGSKIEKITGIITAINYNSLVIVIMTEKEKIIIKNFISVRRKRGMLNTVET